MFVPGDRPSGWTAVVRSTAAHARLTGHRTTERARTEGNRAADEIVGVLLYSCAFWVRVGSVRVGSVMATIFLLVAQDTVAGPAFQGDVLDPTP